MGINSYKKWKTLNENLGPGSFNLGLGQPTNLGLSSQFAVNEKKKAIEVDVESEDDDLDDLGDEDGVIADEGCGCGSKSKKKSGKKSAKASAKKSGKKSAKHMDSDMGGDFEEDDGEPEEKEDGDDESHDDEDMPEEKEDGDDESHDDEGSHDEDGDEEMPKEKEVPPMFSKKKSGKKSGKKSAKKSGKKSAKKMQKEGQNWWQQDDADWMKSVQSMLGPKAQTKYKDGWSEYQEDSLLPVANPNAGSDGSVEAQPGQPGFAPQGRLDVGFNSEISLGEAFKVIEEACENAGPKRQAKLIKKLAQLHNRLL
jgi:hypothetical protein